MSAPGSTGFTIDFIDVGQGDATLVTAISGETLLVDGGRSKNRLRDRLESMGIKDLDAIALTHPDADHVAGLVEVLEMFPVERVYLNGGDSDSQTFGNFMAGVEIEGATVATVSRGDTIPLGGLTLSVVHPGELSGDSNEDSMVLLLDCSNVEVLLTGDAETPSEEEMIVAGVLFDIDVLKIGHHGSRTSSSQPFLDALLPETGVISAGMENSYDHPHEDVMARLAATGMRILETDTSEDADGIRMTSDCQTYDFGPIP
jgi:beta-lactamase superfamily II metal-dependent hydrolase